MLANCPVWFIRYLPSGCSLAVVNKHPRYIHFSQLEIVLESNCCIRVKDAVDYLTVLDCFDVTTVF